MKKKLNGIYRFLPVQLLLLHFRKYQLLLLFWLLIVAVITGNFASAFGASSLFLSPEYLGHINFISMLFLGGGMAVFIMAWHITTFIIHSHRIPFLGATRQSFLKYCINNSIIPITFLIFFSVVSIRFQLMNEHAEIGNVIRLQLGFYIGLLLIIIISFAYFFRVGRDLLKVVLSRITNPARIREIVPYDSLDYEMDIIRADTYLSGKLQLKKCSELEPYHPRFLQTVLRRHHRNAITATVFAYVLLLLSGIFMEDPRFRVPAGCSFLVLFAIIMGMAGAMKYFLRSWEIFGWIIIFLLIAWLVDLQILDFRSRAYGLDYSLAKDERPIYDYNHLNAFFTPQLYQEDKSQEEQRLDIWKTKRAAAGERKPPLIVICASGGGSRSAYWTLRALQYVDSVSNGRLLSNTVLMTGASGGMIGAAYWRELHNAYAEGKIKNIHDPHYQENIGKDVLNAIIFSFASIDLISPFNKISVAGYSYNKDRGYAMEQELIRNSEGLLDKKIGDYAEKEKRADLPAMIINGTIVNDGRKLMVSPLPVSYLCQPAYALQDTAHRPPIDAVDFSAYFSAEKPGNLRLTTALRMNATFPFVLPVVRLPSQPEMNIMDAGLRDNFGIELLTRYLHVFRNWINENAGEVIFIEIRDTREYEVFSPTAMNTLPGMFFDPLFVIQNKWEPIQSYAQSYMKDFAPYYLNNKLNIISLEYIPESRTEAAALNFHLTTKEKKDIYNSMDNYTNQEAVKKLLGLLDKK